MSRSPLLSRRAILLMTVAVFGAGCASGLDNADGTNTPNETSGQSASASAATAEPPPAEVTQTSGSVEGAPASTETAQTTPPATQQQTTTTEQDPLPTECLGLDTPILPTQLTYVAESRLIGLGLNGEPTCLLDLSEGGSADIVAWGAQADRIMFGDGRVDVLGEEGRVGGAAGPDNLAFSLPTGFNMIWLSDGVIQKSTVDDRQLHGLDVGLPVTEALHHPDGQHLLVVVSRGVAGSEVWLTDTEGELGFPLLRSDDAMMSNLLVTPDGSTLVFASEHESGPIHVHSFDIEAAVRDETDSNGRVQKVLRPTDEILVTTVFEAISGVKSIAMDAAGEQIAFAVGDCATGSSIELVDLVIGGYPLPIDPLFSARPVGFVSETQLAIIVYDDTCEGGDLYVANTVTGATDLVRAGVESAAIRRREPAARFSLVDLILTDG